MFQVEILLYRFHVTGQHSLDGWTGVVALRGVGYHKALHQAFVRRKTLMHTYTCRACVQWCPCQSVWSDAPMAAACEGLMFQGPKIILLSHLLITSVLTQSSRSKVLIQWQGRPKWMGIKVCCRVLMLTHRWVGAFSQHVYIEWWAGVWPKFGVRIVGDCGWSRYRGWGWSMVGGEGQECGWSVVRVGYTASLHEALVDGWAEKQGGRQWARAPVLSPHVWPKCSGNTESLIVLRHLNTKEPLLKHFNFVVAIKPQLRKHLCK